MTVRIDSCVLREAKDGLGAPGRDGKAALLCEPRMLYYNIIGLCLPALTLSP